MTYFLQIRLGERPETKDPDLNVFGINPVNDTNEGAQSRTAIKQSGSLICTISPELFNTTKSY